MKKLILLISLLLFMKPLYAQEAIESFDNKNIAVMNDDLDNYWRRIRKLQTNSATEAYVELKFSTTTGHDHDGTDAKKVLATNLDPTGITDTHVLYNNGGTIAGKAITNWALLTSASVSADTNSGDITIAPSKQYMVTIHVEPTTANDTALKLRFNSDSSGDDYAWMWNMFRLDATATSTNLGDDADTEIEIGVDMGATNRSQGGFHGTMYIDTYKNSSGSGVMSATVDGKGVIMKDGNPYHILSAGIYHVDVTIASFEFVTDYAANFEVRVYELSQS